MADFPEGTILIQILGVYDGWSVAKLPDGALVNRWDPADRRHAATQKYIDAAMAEQSAENE